MLLITSLSDSHDSISRPPSFSWRDLAESGLHFPKFISGVESPSSEIPSMDLCCSHSPPKTFHKEHGKYFILNYLLYSTTNKTSNIGRLRWGVRYQICFVCCNLLHTYSPYTLPSPSSLLSPCAPASPGLGAVPCVFAKRFVLAFITPLPVAS
jgi:hypothetical protein